MEKESPVTNTILYSLYEQGLLNFATQDAKVIANVFNVTIPSRWVKYLKFILSK